MKVRDIGAATFSTTGGARTSSSTVVGTGNLQGGSGMLGASGTGPGGFRKQGSKSTALPKKVKEGFSKTR
jgi:hypothetical protein